MNLEEIKEAVKGEPTLLDGLVQYAIESEPGKALLINHAKADFDKNIGTRIGEVYSRIDEDIKTTLGETKPNDVKTYDFIKTKMTELKELKDNGSGDEALKVKISELEGKLESGGSEHWHKTYNEGLAQWTEKEQTLNDSISELNGKIKSTIIQSEIAQGIAAIKLNEGIPQSAQKVIIDNAVLKISEHAKIIEGKVVLHKQGAEGLTPWLNSKYEPVNASDALTEVLQDVIQDKKKSGGNANKGGDFGKLTTVGEGDKTKKTLSLDKSLIHSREDFANQIEEALISNGIARGSKEWHTIEMETREKMGIADLPKMSN